MRLRVRVEDREYDVDVDFLDGARPVRGNGRAREFRIPDAVLRERPAQKLPEDRFCRSPIAGKITAVMASAGQTVRRNEPVLVIEAMKMENKVGPTVGGTIKQISVAPGDMVQPGQILFELI